ncbi:hypothetical protein COCNU_06G013710 [Cocos nucifera]|uniref:Uncharacterized protein n=1 Tax=Cocos nucifera TaxID=13894 RepID=A0A8K0N3Y8_COCNU|nr:hypothetical protein COCNU_06G013710 [Cocos nucifera]
MVRGSLRAANAPRKEKSMPTKAMTTVRSAAPVESVPRPSTSSSKRSSSGPKISIRMSDRGFDVPGSVSPVEVFLDTEDKRKDIGDYRVARSLLKSVILPTNLVHHMDHFIEVIREVRHLSKEAEEKAAQANRRTDDAQLSRLKAEDETKYLRERVKQLKSKLTKVEARVLGEREARKAWAEATRIEAVKAFRASEEFRNIKVDFASLSYLQGGIDLKEKVRRIFPDLNLNLLESDDKKAEEVEGRKIQMEDDFSPARDDLTAEDAASVPPSAIIILSDQVEVGESRTLDGA